MEISFDPAKSERNRIDRGLPFELASQFEFATARINTVFRNGEHRKFAVGYLNDRLHILCYKEVEGGRRIISFRKANKREAQAYGFELCRQPD